jgi:peptide/nickel transport system substrate-binding protein
MRRGLEVPKREAFLRLTMVLLGLLLVSLAVAQQVPTEFNEAPTLAERVAAGELPPVTERLPEPGDLLVLEPVERIGQYGGSLRYMHTGPGLPQIRILMYDPPVRWNRDYTGYIPGLFKGWEYNEDGTVITFSMRRGVRWSDGEPFTTEDILFWWEDLALNEDYGAVPPPWWAFQNEQLASLEVVDDYTFRFHLAGTDWNIPYVLASGFWNFEPMMTPKHYLAQFHPRYNPELDNYDELTEHRDWWQTPGFPTVYAWYTVSYTPGERAILERNPYYYKVDPEGNQLPYIDRIEALEIPDEEVRVLRMISGDIDLSFREVGTARNLAVLLDNAERGGYRFLEGWIEGAGGLPMFMVNQDFVGDDYIRELLRDKNFRRGLSVAINREEVNEVVWHGFGTPQQATITEQSWHFQSPEGRQLFEEWANWYAQYDPDQASELLDAAGLDQRDAQGWRVRADNGQRLELILDHDSWEIQVESAELFRQYFEAVGVRTILHDPPGPELGRRLSEGLFMLRMFGKSELDLWTFPDWIFPTGNEIRMWPMQSLWYRTGGAQGEEPGDVVRRLYDLYLQGLAIPDPEDRHHIVWEAIRIHMEEGPFDIGATGGLITPAMARMNLRNIPDFGILGPWAPGTPGNTDPWQYFFEQE